MTFEGKAKLFQSEASYIELALTPKKQQTSSITLDTDSWKTNQAEFFCVRQVYFTNSCQQIWRCVNQPFTLFIHHI